MLTTSVPVTSLSTPSNALRRDVSCLCKCQVKHGTYKQRFLKKDEIVRREEKCSSNEDRLATTPEAFRLVGVVETEQVVVAGYEIHYYIAYIVALDEVLET